MGSATVPSVAQSGGRALLAALGPSRPPSPKIPGDAPRLLLLPAVALGKEHVVCCLTFSQVTGQHGPLGATCSQGIYFHSRGATP